MSEDRGAGWTHWATIGVLMALLGGAAFFIAWQSKFERALMVDLVQCQEDANSVTGGGYGADIPEKPKSCDGIIEEDLTVSDWERQYKVKSCFSDEWNYHDHKLECPNCGFMLLAFDQQMDDHAVTCQRCGLVMEAWGNLLKVKGVVWDGERYQEKDDE